MLLELQSTALVHDTETTMSKTSSSTTGNGDGMGKPAPYQYEAVQFIGPSPNHSQTNLPVGPYHKREGLRTIVFLFFVIFLPLIAFSVVILYLIFHYRVLPETRLTSDLQTAANEDDADYYYVNFSSTRLLFVTSWSSTVAPMLVGLVMTLSLFPVSRKLFKLSLADNPARLPTPQQV